MGYLRKEFWDGQGEPALKLRHKREFVKSNMVTRQYGSGLMMRNAFNQIKDAI